jgi:putative addiction module component (TIGR02574 family)
LTRRTRNEPQVLALDVQTRLALVRELWDSILEDAQTGAELPISDAEHSELDDRLREDDAHPEQAIPWQAARTGLRNGQ